MLLLIWIKNGSLELTDRISQEQNAVLLWTTTNLIGKECVQFDLTFHFSLPCLHYLEASGHNVPLWTIFRVNAVAMTILLSILTDLILWTYWLKWGIYWQVCFLLQGWADTLWISWNKSWGNYCIGWDSGVHCKDKNIVAFALV